MPRPQRRVEPPSEPTASGLPSVSYFAAGFRRPSRFNGNGYEATGSFALHGLQTEGFASACMSSAMEDSRVLSGMSISPPAVLMSGMRILNGIRRARQSNSRDD